MSGQVRMRFGRAPTRNPVFAWRFNPGRTGFLQLGSDLLLEWRLEAVAHALVESGVDACIIPGARFPAGASLPPGFPFLWEGPTSSGWDTVGLFVRPELEHAFRPIPEISSTREQCLSSGEQAMRPPLAPSSAPCTLSTVGTGTRGRPSLPTCVCCGVAFLPLACF